MSVRRRILATCGGWMPAKWGDVEFSPLQRYALELAGVTGRRPRVTFINTASGDQRADESRELAAAAAAGVDAVHVRLFGRNQPDLREVVFGSDVVWVGGGSVANLLAVWRVHGLDLVLRDAWDSGVLLAGTSAGALCWHVGGPTSTFGDLAVVDDALGFVPYSMGVHDDSQPGRRPAFERAIATGVLPDGFALEEGTAVLYEDENPVDFVSETEDATVHRVERSGTGTVSQRVKTRLLSSGSVAEPAAR